MDQPAIDQQATPQPATTPPSVDASPVSQPTTPPENSTFPGKKFIVVGIGIAFIIGLLIAGKYTNLMQFLKPPTQSSQTDVLQKQADQLAQKYASVTNSPKYDAAHIKLLENFITTTVQKNVVPKFISQAWTISPNKLFLAYRFGGKGYDATAEIDYESNSDNIAKLNIAIQPYNLPDKQLTATTADEIAKQYLLANDPVIPWHCSQSGHIYCDKFMTTASNKHGYGIIYHTYGPNGAKFVIDYCSIPSTSSLFPKVTSCLQL